jgi:hypothetical protein
VNENIYIDHLYMEQCSNIQIYGQISMLQNNYAKTRKVVVKNWSVDISDIEGLAVVIVVIGVTVCYTRQASREDQCASRKTTVLEPGHAWLLDLQEGGGREGPPLYTRRPVLEGPALPVCGVAAEITADIHEPPYEEAAHRQELEHPQQVEPQPRKTGFMSYNF